MNDVGQTKRDEARAEQRLCTFFLGDLFLGVPVACVQEVIRHQELTRVPLAPSIVRGLINLRGQIVTAIDLRQRFELPPIEAGRLANNVVICTEDGPVSLLVDEIGDVIEPDTSAYEPPLGTIGPVARELIAGIYKLEGRLLLVLDTERALTVDGKART